MGRYRAENELENPVSPFDAVAPNTREQPLQDSNDAAGKMDALRAGGCDEILEFAQRADRSAKRRLHAARAAKTEDVITLRRGDGGAKPPIAG